MQDYEFQRTDEVAGTWEPGEGAKWRTGKGELFFLATWSEGPVQFGWFGIYHESLTHLDSSARDIAEAITSDASDRRRWSNLAELSNETPGWGLVRASGKKLQLWRDPIGRLPIFRCRYRRGVEWGTRPEILSGFEGKIRRSRLEEFLARSRSERRDEFWQNINRTRAGECLVVDGHHRPDFVDWWPGPVKTDLDYGDAEQRIRALLLEAAERIVDRGGRLISMSGGVDSTLLLSLLRSQGRDVEAVSMVDPTAPFFDERGVIEEVLDKTDTDGHFVNIGGPMAWDSPQYYHPVVGFGPASHPEPPYVRPFLNEAAELLDDEPRVLISGTGADQIFGCSRHIFIRDAIAKSRGSTVAVNEREWKILGKHLARTCGIDKIPLPNGGSNSDRPPWLGDGSLEGVVCWSGVYHRQGWLKRRRSQFKRWLWEHTVRLMEGYRRTTSWLKEWPYLEPGIADYALSFPPVVVRTEAHTKILLRCLLRGKVSPDIAFRPKRGTFDEIVWRGYYRHFQPSIGELFTNSNLDQAGLIGENELRDYSHGISQSTGTIFRPHGNLFWRAVNGELWLREVEEESSK